MCAKPWTILRLRTLSRVILQAVEFVLSTKTIKMHTSSNVRCHSSVKRVIVRPTKAPMPARSWEEKRKILTLRTLNL